MSSKLSIPALFLCLFSFTASAFGGDLDFTGQWKLDKEKSEMSDVPLYLSQIKITQEGNNLQTTRTYSNQYGEQYPFDEEIVVDGKDREITIYEMKRSTTSSWSDDGKSLLIKSITKYYGNSGEEEIVTDETWNLLDKGKAISVKYSIVTVNGKYSGTNHYVKAEQ